MKIVVYLIGIIVTLTICLALWVRLAPVDVDRWHVDLSNGDVQVGDNWTGFCAPTGHRDAVEVADAADTLAQLDKIALATPRTFRLAGSPQEGRITWITRSRVLGFPDYTTAATLSDPTKSPPSHLLCVVARQGMGKADFGVNGRRLGAWVQALTGLNETPDLQGPDALRARLNRD